jgi:Ca2+-dependent lipid-binding protein
MYVRDQLGENPDVDDPIVAFWKGDFVNRLLGKDYYIVPFKQFTQHYKSFDELSDFCTIKVGFGYSPVKVDVELSDSHNTGVLHLDILSASELPAADSNGFSDPYVIVYLNGKEIHKTKTKKKTLNPEFEEGLETEIASRFLSKLLFEVRDFNQFSSHVVLGHCSIPLAEVKSEEVITTKLKLEKAKSGYVTIRYMFEPRKLKKIISTANETDSRFKTETSSFGKFGRGLTSQVTGIGKTLFGGKSGRGSFDGLPSLTPESPDENLPILKPDITAELVTKTEVTTIVPVKEDSVNPVLENNSNLNGIIEKKTSRLSVSSISDRASMHSLQSRVEDGEGFHIRILGAKGLKAADSGGTSDPYVKVYISGSNKKSMYKTTCLKKTLDPVWEKEAFTLSTPVTLKFCIIDKNVISSDVPLGFVLVNLATVFGENDKFEDWYTIQDGSGTLHLAGEIGKGNGLQKNKSSIFKRSPREFSAI